MRCLGANAGTGKAETEKGGVCGDGAGWKGEARAPSRPTTGHWAAPGDPISLELGHVPPEHTREKERSHGVWHCFRERGKGTPLPFSFHSFL